jgi:hypothetical protein
MAKLAQPRLLRRKYSKLLSLAHALFVFGNASTTTPATVNHMLFMTILQVVRKKQLAVGQTLHPVPF